MVDLVVQKAHGDQVSIMINTHSMEGSKFFTKNQGELLQTLVQSGVNVSDLKLDSSSNTNSNGQIIWMERTRETQINNTHAMTNNKEMKIHKEDKNYGIF
jgi:hypothetical protein